MSCIFDTPEHALGGCIFESPIFTANKVVQVLLTDEFGDFRTNLANLSWAWFDDVDPNGFGTPADQGALETTDGAGLLSITLTGTALGIGQSGMLVVRSDDGAFMGAYNLEIGGAAELAIFAEPEHSLGGCIFAPGDSFLVGAEVGGGTSSGRRRRGVTRSNRNLALEEDEQIIAVLMALLQSRRIH